MKLLTPMRTKRAKRATRERQEVAIRSDTPTDSLREYFAAAIRFPFMVIPRRISVVSVEALEDIAE